MGKRGSCPSETGQGSCCGIPAPTRAVSPQSPAPPEVVESPASRNITGDSNLPSSFCIWGVDGQQDCLWDQIIRIWVLTCLPPAV